MLAIGLITVPGGGRMEDVEGKKAGVLTQDRGGRIGF
jgi:hypothetical protein